MNAAFDSALGDYRQAYDNTLHHSAIFRDYEADLARRLARRYVARGGRVAEIGCGAARFLGLVCAAADARGLGYDPSHDPAYLDDHAAGRVTVVRDYYTGQASARPVDLVCCRHVAEHMPDPVSFLASIRSGLAASGTALYVEVPNGISTLRRPAVWDIIYEHAIMLVAPTLRRILADAGFAPVEVADAYSGQFLWAEAKAAEGAISVSDDQAELERVAADVDAFGARFERAVHEWRGRLEEMARAGRRVVAWGAGARSVSFFNAVGIRQEIEYVVDQNPRKQGTFLAGTGQSIVPPERLAEIRPETVIVINPVYAGEVETTLSGLGIRAEVVTAS